jgi:hypothetical protein
LQLNIKKGEDKMNEKIIETRDLTNELYGIFVDYLIDTNQFLAMDNIYSYENFLNFDKWYLAKIEVYDKLYLIVDVSINRYSYCNYCRINKEILISNLNSKDAVEKLKAYSKSSGIGLLDQMRFYLNEDAISYEFI